MCAVFMRLGPCDILKNSPNVQYLCSRRERGRKNVIIQSHQEFVAIITAQIWWILWICSSISVSNEIDGGDEEFVIL